MYVVSQRYTQSNKGVSCVDVLMVHSMHNVVIGLVLSDVWTALLNDLLFCIDLSIQKGGEFYII